MIWYDLSLLYIKVSWCARSWRIHSTERRSLQELSLCSSNLTLRTPSSSLHFLVNMSAQWLLQHMGSFMSSCLPTPSLHYHLLPRVFSLLLLQPLLFSFNWPIFFTFNPVYAAYKWKNLWHRATMGFCWPDALLLPIQAMHSVRAPRETCYDYNIIIITTLMQKFSYKHGSQSGTQLVGQYEGEYSLRLSQWSSNLGKKSVKYFDALSAVILLLWDHDNSAMSILDKTTQQCDTGNKLVRVVIVVVVVVFVVVALVKSFTKVNWLVDIA